MVEDQVKHQHTELLKTNEKLQKKITTYSKILSIMGEDDEADPKTIRDQFAFNWVQIVNIFMSEVPMDINRLIFKDIVQALSSNNGAVVEKELEQLIQAKEVCKSQIVE